MEDFKIKTQRDALVSLNLDLERLKRISNLPEHHSKVIDKEMEGFTKLFAKFLASDAQDSIRWDDIEKLPPGAVSSHKF